MASRGLATLQLGDALMLYRTWETPTCIISDGPYGLGKFPGEAPTPDDLAEWYAPHAAEWARLATPRQLYGSGTANWGGQPFIPSLNCGIV